MNKIYDFAGIGPFNLAWPAPSRAHRRPRLPARPRRGFNWHPGMMLDSATLQTPFMADLVTLADPTSRFSFQLRQQIGRLYAFYIKEDFFPMRREYNQYCQWVVEQLDSLRFGHFVQHDYLDERRGYRARGCSAAARGFEFLTRRLVLGTGTTPHSPSCCEGVADHVSHSGNYLQDKPRLQGKRSITVVGSGQSAAEIYYDLLQEIDRHDYQLNWITRAPRFFPLEYTKLTLEMTSPEYIDYFHSLPRSTRKAHRQPEGPVQGHQRYADQRHLRRAVQPEPQGRGADPAADQRRTAPLPAPGRRHAGAGVLPARTAAELPAPLRSAGDGQRLSVPLPRFIQPIAERIVWQAPERFAVRATTASTATAARSSCRTPGLPITAW